MNSTLIKLPTLADAEEFVSRDRMAEWDGWNINIFAPKDYAEMNKRGVYSRKHAAWGFMWTYPVLSDGTWDVTVMSYKGPKKWVAA